MIQLSREFPRITSSATRVISRTNINF